MGKFNWLFDLVNSFLPFDLNILSFLFKPLKAFLFYSIWYYIKDFIYENTIHKVKTTYLMIKDSLSYIKSKVNRLKNVLGWRNTLKTPEDLGVVGQRPRIGATSAAPHKGVSHTASKNKSRFLFYLFREFNLFE